MAVVAGLLGGLAGCAVGPDFHTPAAPTNTQYTRGAQPGVTDTAGVDAGNSQQFVYDRDIPADWYALFQSDPLNELVRTALRDSPTVAAAKAALLSAQATYRAERGALLIPTADGQLGGTRERVPGAEFGDPQIPAQTFSLYTAQVNVAYHLDIFGSARRQLEALRSQSDYQHWELEAANLTLTGNVIASAFQIASLRGQLKALGDVVTAETAQLKVVQRQFDAGGASRADVLQQQSQLAQAQSQVPVLDTALAQAQHRLAVLAGRTPDDESIPVFDLEHLSLPVELPVSVPAKLVRQRPDVRAAEALLHQASANVGVATANLYPQLALTASLSSVSLTSGGLFGAGTEAWSAAASLTQPLFHGGELRYKRRAALENLEQAAAQYREVVLEAMEQVADALRALENDARNLHADVDAEHAAAGALDLTQKQFKIGGVSYLAVLNSQRLYLGALQARVQAQAARYTDSAALFQALGGGWWNRDAGGSATSSGQADPAAMSSKGGAQ